MTSDVSVPAQSSKKACLTPALDKAALYQLTAPDNQMIDATAKDAVGNDLGSVHMTVPVHPVDDIAWSSTGIDPKVMQELAAVFVEPNAPDIDKVQRLAQPYSVFGGGANPPWGNGEGAYQRSAYARQADIPPGQFAYEDFVIEPAETTLNIQWEIGTVTCSPCTDETVDVAIFTAAQFAAYKAGTSDVATAVWTAQGTNALGMTVLATPGQYFITFLNPSSNFVDRTVTWARTVTREDVVRDFLISVFQVLRAAGVTYSSVTSTFFTNWQHVRRVTESLETLSANCIDGSFVFASVAELLGMEPVLIHVTGHEYMGVRSAPGSSVIWPIETTMVGNMTVTPFQAYQTGFSEMQTDSANDPNYQEIDIATLRNRSVTPLVQQ
ncbi:MAG TPA: hypothetical protein VHO06_21960 [Polyangia bacterium]|nr:hypothetical protein [Polyangia bacterium]